MLKIFNLREYRFCDIPIRLNRRIRKLKLAIQLEVVILLYIYIINPMGIQIKKYPDHMNPIKLFDNDINLEKFMIHNNRQWLIHRESD